MKAAYMVRYVYRKDGLLHEHRVAMQEYDEAWRYAKHVMTRARDNKIRLELGIYRKDELCFRGHVRKRG